MHANRLSIPVYLNWPSLSSLPKSYWITPLELSFGSLTIIAPSRISVLLLGTPPPIPTIRWKRIEWKPDSNRILTITADILPYTPFGKLVRTTLCSLMLPIIYFFDLSADEAKASVFYPISASQPRSLPARNISIRPYNCRRIGSWHP